MKPGIGTFTTLAVAGLLAAAFPAGAQSTASDVQIQLDDFGFSGYFVSAFAPAAANVAPTGSSNINPTMRLEVGKRYKFTYTNAGGHPFEVIAKDANPGNDVVLLSLAGSGSFESDAAVGWLESGSDFYFTLTPALATAMQPSGKVAGYRCNFHPFDMRGNFNVITSGVENWPEYK